MADAYSCSDKLPKEEKSREGGISARNPYASRFVFCGKRYSFALYLLRYFHSSCTIELVGWMWSMVLEERRGTSKLLVPTTCFICHRFLPIGDDDAVIKHSAKHFQTNLSPPCYFSARGPLRGAAQDSLTTS